MTIGCLVLWGVIGSASTAGILFPSINTYLEKLRIPQWPLHVWIIGFLAIAAVAVFEGGYRQAISLQQKITKLNNRFIPRLAISGVPIIQPTETENPPAMNLFVQLLPECLTDAPVEECQAFLLSVSKRMRGEQEWKITGMNSPLHMGWDYYGHGPLTLHQGIKQRLNVCWWGDSQMFIIPAVQPIPSKVRTIFNSSGDFKFDIRITAKDCPHVDASVVVNLDDRIWNKPLVIVKKENFKQ